MSSSFLVLFNCNYFHIIERKKNNTFNLAVNLSRTGSGSILTKGMDSDPKHWPTAHWSHHWDEKSPGTDDSET